MEKEIWKPIQGYEGIYDVSTVSRVRSLDRIVPVECRRRGTYTQRVKGRIMKPKLTKQGYLEYGLSNGKKGDISWFRANRLVAQAFIPNPDNLPCVHHIDHNKLNNNVGNLKWVTHQQNKQAEIDDGCYYNTFKIGINHHNAKYTDEQILEMFTLEKKGLRRSEIAEKIGCSRSYVTNILKDRKRICSKQF